MDSSLEEELVLIGKNIKRIRKKKQISLKKLAEMVDISAPYLSQIENGKVNFNLNDLTVIGNALNVSISAFFVDPHRNAKRLIRKRDIVWKPLAGNSKEAILRKTLRDFDLSILSVPMNENTGHKSQHDGKELCYVTSGELVIQLEGKEDQCLETGDSCFFSANIPHRWKNEKPETATFVLINTM